MTRKLVALEVEHIDVGLTILTQISLNGQLLIAYKPGTRHEEKAEESLNELLQNAFRGIFKEAANNTGYVHSVTFDDLPSEDDEDYDYRPEY